VWYNEAAVVAGRPKSQYDEAPLVGAGVPGVLVVLSHTNNVGSWGKTASHRSHRSTPEPTSGAFCISGGGDHGP